MSFGESLQGTARNICSQREMSLVDRVMADLLFSPKKKKKKKIPFEKNFSRRKFSLRWINVVLLFFLLFGIPLVEPANDGARKGKLSSFVLLVMLSRLFAVHLFRSSRSMSSLLSPSTHKSLLTELDLQEENLGVFDGQWFANGEVSSLSLSLSLSHCSLFSSLVFFSSLIRCVQRRMK